MDARKRKRLQGRARVRKLRALAKASNRCNFVDVSSSSENSSFEDDNSQFVNGGRHSPEIDHGSIDEIGNVSDVESQRIDVNSEDERSNAASETFSSENQEVEDEANAIDHEQETLSTTDADRENQDSLTMTSESDEADGSSIQEEGSENERFNSNFSDDSERTDIENEDAADIDRLRVWAIKGKIEQIRVDELLQILRRRLLPDLPKSAKTFLHTSSAKYTIQNMQDGEGNPGQFLYFGIKAGLEACIDPEVHAGNTIELKFCIDGLPLRKSGDEDFWPHLCQEHFSPDIYEPFPVSIFSGSSKPASTDVYFEKFLEEMNSLLRDGIEISGKHFIVQIKCFVCDTPARAFCKNTVGHTGKHACERCTVKGTKKDIGTTVYPSADCTERSDQSFRNQTQPLHHNGRSNLLEIRPNIDMIFTFILDFMHLCCLGIMKKLMEWWLSGDLSVRLGPRMKDVLSDRMELLKSQVPCEFQRKPITTRKFRKWKATQFRFFLLYAGPVVLKNVLSPRLYKHFLLLHGACRILCSDNVCLTLNRYAKQYLRTFFIGLKHFYGKTSQTLNSHHLIHLADDVIKMGCSLSRISAFVFENFLGKLKKKLRTPNKALAQVCRRLHEENFVSTIKPAIPPEIQILKVKANKILKIKYKEYTIGNKEPDSTVLLNNGKFLKVKRIYQTDQGVQIAGLILTKKKSIFNYPFESNLLNMWEVHRKSSRGLKTYPLTSIEMKVVKLSTTVRFNGSKHVFVIPLLHND